MEELLRRVQGDPELAPALPTIISWYCLDENVLPKAVYELRPMSVVRDDASVPESARDFWAAEKVMAAALRAAAKRAELPRERLEDWSLSVTHKVGAGART